MFKYYTARTEYLPTNGKLSITIRYIQFQEYRDSYKINWREYLDSYKKINFWKMWISLSLDRYSCTRYLVAIFTCWKFVHKLIRLTTWTRSRQIWQIRFSWTTIDSDVDGCRISRVRRRTLRACAGTNCRTWVAKVAPRSATSPWSKRTGAHDRVFYLSVDRDTTSRYGKHYFRRKYADTIDESKSADVPWLCESLFPTTDYY